MSPELLEDAIRLKQRLPETVREVAVVSGMNPIGAEGMLVDLDLDAGSAELCHHSFEEVGHRPWLQGEMALPPVAGQNIQTMPIKVEDDLESPAFVIDWRRRKAARIHVERNMPGVIKPRRKSKPNLANDLRPKMKGLAGFFPILERQLRPGAAFTGDHDFAPAQMSLSA
jgi:hypothetical protein